VATAPARVDVLLYGYVLSSGQGSAGFCGIYLIRSGTETIVFDTGHAGRRRALVVRLARHGLAPDDVTAVVVSHSHYDHVQNVDLFPRAALFLHPAELAGAPGDPARPPWTDHLFRERDVRLVADATEIAPGVRILHLPGHTAGSVGLVADTASGAAVCTGDALSSAAALRAGVPAAVRGDAAQARGSLRRAAALADVIFPGHDAPYQVHGGRPGRYLAPAPPPFGG
jgi:glyoxylase-like metal-dependent hydrolase (beta-lactamase superfamily II)